MNLSNRSETSFRCRALSVQASRESCRKTLSGLAQVKDAILSEFGKTCQIREKLIRLALNEAEALAWETSYPHLLFPALAAEKVGQVMRWSQRQQAVRQTSPVLAFSA